MKVGDRVEFIAHGDPDPAPLTAGEQGTVTHVGEWLNWPTRPTRWRQIRVKWDSGRTLMLIQPIDWFRVLS